MKIAAYCRVSTLGAMAQQESANMSKRVKFGKDITAQKGRVPNLVFGYDKMPNERYTLKINDEEAKIVKEIFESYVYKGIGTTKIAWDLNDRGIRTKKTKSKWVQTSIVRMLKNPIYRVVLEENKAERHIRGGMATKLKYHNKKLTLCKYSGSR